MLNSLWIDPEQGTIDSPLNVAQVRVIPAVPAALKRLNELGFTLVIISNQPAAAKGKTTRANLEAVHARIVQEAQSAGAVISASYLCFHRQEDGCACRKPGIASVQQAFRDHPGASTELSWMVGDGVTDIEAGQRAGLNTAFVSSHKCDVCQALRQHAEAPTLWVTSLDDLANRLSQGKVHPKEGAKR